MTFFQNARRMAAVAAVATAAVFGASAAIAQHHGMHGHGGGGTDIGELIAHAKAQLNLNTMQQSMFDAAVASSKSAHQAARASHQKVIGALQAELANAEPNLRAVAAAADAARNDAQAQRAQAREQWLKLYDTFTADQKAVVKTILQKRLTRMEAFRQKMLEHMHHRSAGTSG